MQKPTQKRVGFLRVWTLWERTSQNSQGVGDSDVTHKGEMICSDNTNYKGSVFIASN